MEIGLLLALGIIAGALSFGLAFLLSERQRLVRELAETKRVSLRRRQTIIEQFDVIRRLRDKIVTLQEAAGLDSFATINWPSEVEYKEDFEVNMKAIAEIMDAKGGEDGEGH